MTETPELARLRRELGEQLASKRVLYLDVSYWGMLCDVALGVERDPHARELATALARERKDGNLVCPIEWTVVRELAKQRLEPKRRATVEAIDHYSDGIVILSPPERVFLEALRLIQVLHRGPPFPAPPRDEVWTRAAFFVGHGQFESESLPADLLADLNAYAVRELWQLRFADMLDTILAGIDSGVEEAVAQSRALNQSKSTAREEFPSLKRLYLSEVAGVLRAYRSQLGEVGEYMYFRATGTLANVEPLERERYGKEIARLLSLGFETLQRELARSLPSVHVQATLYARVQWDEARKYKPNDMADFAHAAAAMGYCNAFATERSLATLLRQSGLDALYGIRVLSSPTELIAWLGEGRANVAT
ncbi:MAG: hypothetical protein MUF00_17120 [Gemmatimonadaceae bacterium]|jgi:hypothetical protein|nr:hypothetical protein [Gemmatimonadaceae bacterium]